jgi:glycosyltransferase involved in cell wall biosynthesis
MMKKNLFDSSTIYIECGPIICERQFSGIPNVNYHLAKDAASRFGMDRVHFFHGPNVINKEAISEILRAKTNEPVKKYEAEGRLFVEPLSSSIKRTSYSIGLFTNSRHGLGRLFDFECQIFHDLTPIITPEFHHQDTIEFHAHEYQRDIDLLDCAICVSESTKKDVTSYLGLQEERIIVSHLGAEDIDEQLQTTIDHISGLEVEPYIVIVGTIEPRKNHKILFEYLLKNPEVLDSYKVVVVGRNGWGINFETLLAKLDGLSPERKSKIIHLGFVSDELKTALITKASFSVYASYYEGFGLPVIEALRLGCPVLASFSSSIPEAGGPACEYFDPDYIESFAQAFKSLDLKIKEDRAAVVSKGINWAAGFTWDKFSSRIYAGIRQQIEGNVV